MRSHNYWLLGGWMVAVLILLLLLPSYSYALGETYEYKKDATTSAYGKITIKDNFGLPFISKTISEYELQENSDQCLTNCYADLKITLYQDSSMYDALNFYFKNNKKASAQFRIYVHEKQKYNVTIYEYGTCKENYYNNATGNTELRDISCITKTKQKEKQRNVLREISANEIFLGSEEGIKYNLKIAAVKKPFESIDWKIRVKNLELNEFAWWDSNWIKVLNITINNSKAYQLIDYSANITIDGLSLIGNGMDVNGKDFRVTQNLVEIPFYNATSFARSDANIVIKVNLTRSSNTSDIQIYYSNPAATYAGHTLKDVYGIYETFNYTDADGNNEDWVSYGFGSWAINNGNASGIGVLGGSNLPDILCKKNLNISSSFILEYDGFYIAAGLGAYLLFNETGSANDQTDNRSYALYVDYASAPNKPIFSWLVNASSAAAQPINQFTNNFTQPATIARYRVEIKKGNFEDFMLNASINFLNGTIISAENNSVEPRLVINTTDRMKYGVAGSICLMDSSNAINNFSRVILYQSEDIAYYVGQAAGISIGTLYPANTFTNTTTNLSFTNYFIVTDEGNLSNYTLKIYRKDPYSLYSSDYFELGNVNYSLSHNLTKQILTDGTFYWNVTLEGYSSGIFNKINSAEKNFNMNAHTILPYYLGSILEQETITIGFNITRDILNQANATLNYNGTIYPMPLLFNNATDASFVKSFVAPVIAANTNFTFNISYYVNSYLYNTSQYSQMIYKLPNLSVGSCSNDVALTFDLKDEENLSAITADVSYNFKFGVSNNTAINTYGNLTKVSTFNICINSTISTIWSLGYGELQYKLDTGDSATSYVSRRYYLFTNTTLTNQTIQNITLYDLLSKSSTSFQVEIQDSTLNPFSKVYARLLRWYPSLNQYYVVDSGITDEDGTTILHVVTEDVDYRIGVYYPNGTLIKLADPIRMVCLATPCSYTLKVLPSDIDYTSALTLQYSFTYNQTTSMWSFIYSDTTGKTNTMNLSIYQLTATGKRLICNSLSTGSVGVANCNTTGYTGKMIGEVYRAASPPMHIASLLVDLITSAFKSSFGLWLSLLIAIPIIFALSMFSPMAALIGGIIALLPAYYFGSINLIIIGGLAVAAAIVAHFLKRI